jgi:hypothetical protein
LQRFLAAISLLFLSAAVVRALARFKVVKILLEFSHPLINDHRRHNGLRFRCGAPATYLLDASARAAFDDVNCESVARGFAKLWRFLNYATTPI